MATRLHQLDSLRGIAALTVMNSHLMLTLPFVWDTTKPEAASIWTNLILFSPLRILFAGHEAVIFFFVLSGFVLAQPLLQTGPKLAAYPGYLVKRVLRIYPPYLVAALLAIIACNFWSGPEIKNASGWFQQSWKNPITFQAVSDHILMIGAFNNCDYNPVLWSLVHEMRISILFPGIMWLLLRHPRICITLPVFFTLLDWLSISLRFHGHLDFSHDYFSTLHYSGFFILGAYLAKNCEKPLRIAASLRPALKCSVLLCGILAYTNAFYLPHLAQSLPKPLRLLVGKSWSQDWLTAAGVTVFILFALSSSKASSLLGSRVLLFLGAISYSLYLFHALILKSVVTLYGNQYPLVMLLLLSGILSLGVGWMSWKWIEVPSIALARSFSAKVNKCLASN